MLVILPFIVLFAVSLLILIFGRIRRRLGTIWMVSAVMVILTWAGVIVLRMNLPTPFTIANWLPGQVSTDAIQFSFTPDSWFLSVAWLALLVSVIFFDAAGLEGPYSNLILSGSMAIAAVTLLSLTSSNLLTFLLAWSLIDLIEFIVLAQWIDDTELMRKTVVSFGFRLAGTLLVIAALAISKQSSQPFQIASAQGLLYVLLLVGVGLRLGIQPVHLPFTHSELVRRTLGTVMRLASPISAFALLIQLSSPQNMNGILLLVAAFATLAAVYGAGRWATSQSDTAGRQFWTLSLSGIAILAAMNGQSSVVLACAGIMVLAGGFIFVQQGRERTQRLLFIILMLGLTGLPFTPFSGLWGFDGGTSWSFTRLVQLISMALLILGAARLYAKKELGSHTGENWISFFASAGLIVLTLTPWLTLIWTINLRGLNPGWWYALVLLGLIGASFTFRTYFLDRLNKSDRAVQFIRDIAVVSARALRNFFRFSWLFSIFAWIYRQLQVLIQFFEGMLEGEGGILWALVFLALLASVLASAGK